MKEKLIIIGAGGHAKSCLDVIELENKFEVLGFVDKAPTRTKIYNYDILGSDADLKSLYKKCKYAFLGIGQIKNFSLRIELFELLKSIGFHLPTIISPLAYISKFAFVDKEGSIIMHQALINANAKIGKACIINTKALIEHDALIEDFCHIATAAVVNGACKVGAKSLVGSNSILKHGQILQPQSVFFGTKNYANGGGAFNLS